MKHIEFLKEEEADQYLPLGLYRYLSGQTKILKEEDFIGCESCDPLNKGFVRKGTRMAFCDCRKQYTASGGYVSAVKLSGMIPSQLLDVRLFKESLSSMFSKNLFHKEIAEFDEFLNTIEDRDYGSTIDLQLELGRDRNWSTNLNFFRSYVFNKFAFKGKKVLVTSLLDILDGISREFMDSEENRSMRYLLNNYDVIYITDVDSYSSSHSFSPSKAITFLKRWFKDFRAENPKKTLILDSTSSIEEAMKSIEKKGEDSFIGKLSLGDMWKLYKVISDSLTYDMRRESYTLPLKVTLGEDAGASDVSQVSFGGSSRPALKNPDSLKGFGTRSIGVKK